MLKGNRRESILYSGQGRELGDEPSQLQLRASCSNIDPEALGGFLLSWNWTFFKEGPWAEGVTWTESFLLAKSEVWVRQKGGENKSPQGPSSPESPGHPEELHK